VREDSQESHRITPVRLQVPKVHARGRGDDGSDGSMCESVGESGRMPTCIVIRVVRKTPDWSGCEDGEGAPPMGIEPPMSWISQL
jgi:hypothetical protein